MSNLALDRLATLSRSQADDDSLLLAVPAARLLCSNEAALHRALAQGLKILAAQSQSSTKAKTIRFADSQGHRRDLYTPLVLHLHLAAFEKHYESLDQSLWSACEDALPQAVELIRPVERFADVPPPATEVALVLWQALCLARFGHMTARDVDVELADSIVHAALSHHDKAVTVAIDPGASGTVASSPNPTEPLCPQSPEQAIETWTYHDLAGLHALANLATLRGNTQWQQRVESIARFHQENTQPDHATGEPWGLPAFLHTTQTKPLADEMIHHTTAQGPEKITPLTAMLLADTVYSIEHKSG